MDPGPIARRVSTRWPSRQFGPLGALVLVTLLIVALSTGISAVMYLYRYLNPLLTDRQLNNYFAYYQDLVAAPLIILALLAMLLLRLPAGRFVLPTSRRFLAAVIFAVLIGCYAGSRLLLGGYGLSIDEFMADFDAGILRRGSMFAEVPVAWRGFIDALQPIWLFRTAGGEFWSSSYLPGNAAIRSILAIAGDAALAGPVLAAASVGLIYSVALKLDPGNRRFAIVAVLLLATSSQFLITAMTPYAMTAHLALNLAWLWCALHDRGWSRATAVGISFLACGLHQMIFHPLFVAPFLVWLWFSGRRGPAILYGLSTAAFALFWINYWSIGLAIAAPGAQTAGVLQAPLFDRIELLVANAMRTVSLVHSGDNLLRLLTWQNPFLWVSFTAALLSPRRLPGMGWTMLAGIFVTLAAMLLLMPAQGHGWGYRYLHGLLGNFALLGAYGWKRISELPSLKGPDVDGWLVLSAAFSLLILLPLRAWQVDAFVRPYRQADARIAAIPADIVIIDHGSRWFAQDLVRNDPFLTNRPLRMLASKLDPNDAARLCRAFRVRVISRSSPELASLRPVVFRGELPASSRRLRRLRSAGCH